MNSVDRELLARLTQEISLRVPAVYGIDSQLEPTAPIELHRRYSFMFRYWVKLPNGAVQPILVKIPHDSWMTTFKEAIESEHIRDVIRSEFETMTTIAGAIARSNKTELTAIHPRLLLLEFNALVMDEIPIRMLKTELSKIPIMLGSKVAWQEFETYLQRSGDWLKTVHSQFSAGQHVSIVELDLMEKVTGQLSILHQLYGLSMGYLQSLFRDLYNCIRTTHLPLASLHNDYQPGNIFITEDNKIGVLDPNWVDQGSIFDDLSSMLIYPVTGKLQLLTMGLRFRSALQQRYERAFLRGYYGDMPVPFATLYFYCAVDILEKWCDTEEVLKSSNFRLYRFSSWLLLPWIRFYFGRLIMMYLNRGIRAGRNSP